MSEANDRKAVDASDREVGSAEEFIEDVFGGIEYEFTGHFGQKWTPEINGLFQEALFACRMLAQEMDERAARAAYSAYAAQPRPPRQLTNYPKGK